MRRTGRARTWGALLVGCALVCSCSKFQRKHVPVEGVPELGYPRCGEDAVPESGPVLFEEHLRSGPRHADAHVVERFRFERRACTITAVVRQEWPLGTADVEVVYDAAYRPLRIWKRMTLPGPENPGEHAQIRRYELRSEPVTIKRRHPSGKVDYEKLLGGAPTVVIGPGRGLLSAWIKRARLGVGQRVKEMAIDIRPELEKIEPAVLLRERDLSDPSLGGAVQVYTFFGRETVFADAEGTVIGDLAGLRQHARLASKPPAPIPLWGPLLPRSTP